MGFSSHEGRTNFVALPLPNLCSHAQQVPFRAGAVGPASVVARRSPCSGGVSGLGIGEWHAEHIDVPVLDTREQTLFVNDPMWNKYVTSSRLVKVKEGGAGFFLRWTDCSMECVFAGYAGSLFSAEKEKGSPFHRHGLLQARCRNRAPLHRRAHPSPYFGTSRFQRCELWCGESSRRGSLLPDFVAPTSLSPGQESS